MKTKKALTNPTALGLYIIAAIVIIVRYTPYFNYLNYKR